MYIKVKHHNSFGSRVLNYYWSATLYTYVTSSFLILSVRGSEVPNVVFVPPLEEACHKNKPTMNKISFVIIDCLHILLKDVKILNH